MGTDTGVRLVGESWVQGRRRESSLVFSAQGTNALQGAGANLRFNKEYLGAQSDFSRRCSRKIVFPAPACSSTRSGEQDSSSGPVQSRRQRGRSGKAAAAGAAEEPSRRPPSCSRPAGRAARTHRPQLGVGVVHLQRGRAH